MSRLTVRVEYGMIRYQVRPSSKAWDDRGPDLLRTRANLYSRTAELVRPGRYHGRVQTPSGSWRRWQDLGPKDEVLEWLADTVPRLAPRRQIQLAKRDLRPLVVVRSRPIAVSSIPCATDRVELGWALVRAAFPAARWLGAYVYKRVNSSSDPRDPWSDHAFQDAYDAGPFGRRVTNDELTDWQIRMAREDLTPAEQVIGSRNGAVVHAEAPDWRVERGGPTSHLTHVHTSCKRHTGTPRRCRG